MKTLSQFTGKYSISKTLRFELRPQGKTLENILKNKFLEKDEGRAEDYKKIKKLIDEYHKHFIAESLEGLMLEGLDGFADLYFKKEKDDREVKAFENLQILLRKQIVSAFTKSPRFKRLFQKELILEDLPQWLVNAEDKDLVSKFNRFTTYFTGFYENRKNIYDLEPKATAVAFRMIHENLPKFLDNLAVYQKRILAHEDLDLDGCEETMTEILQGYTISEVFGLDFFNETLTQRGIDVYNSVLGGFTKVNGEKIQGVNELINLYRQKHHLKSKELPNLKPLFKQILSDRQSASYLPEQFESDRELLVALAGFANELFPTQGKLSISDQIRNSLRKLKDAELDQVYYRSGIPLTNLSQQLFKNWSVIPNALGQYYESSINPLGSKKRTAKYDEAKGKWLKSASFSIYQVQQALDIYISGIDELERKDVAGFLEAFTLDEIDLGQKIIRSVEDVKPLLDQPSLSKDPKIRKQEIARIKGFLDTLMDVIHFVKPMILISTESEKDPGFYGEFEPLADELNTIVPLYNKVRSYLTKKSYSTEKFKLNFENSTLLDGWDANKESDNSGILLHRDGLFYLAIMDKNHNKVFKSIPSDSGFDHYDKVVYKLLPGANKMLPKVFFSEKNRDYFAPSSDLLDRYQAGTHKKGDGFDLGHCHQLVDFFKSSINRHPDWKNFEFQFSDTSSYEDISGFYREVENQGYKLSFQPVPSSYLDDLVSEGKIYLFQIYNKDFSSYSKGKPNLHTLYWKALFDLENLKDVVYKLNGQAEIFFRQKSINYTEEQLKKGHHAEELKGKFDYPIVKDRRFAFDKFQFHVPITLNFKSGGTPNLNLNILEFLKNNRDIHVIGIDRGERHLLYLTLVDRGGRIKAQYSLNQIVSQGKDREYRTDYHGLLDSKEKGRQDARRNWDTIETIKELKEGYLSQVVHQLAKLIVENNAIVIMEDLNAGFKRGRQKVEKQVYQKFEKMLIDKLNYLVFKERKATEAGGLLRALQLSNRFDSFTSIGKQSGVIFYVPAALTSKIDPATGFVNFLNTKYESVEKSKELISQLNSVWYDKDKEHFCIDIDFAKIKGCRVPEGTQSRWTLNATPHIRYRWNKSLTLGKGAQEAVDVNLKLQDLFGRFGIPYAQGQNLVPNMQDQNEKEFFSGFLSLLGCLLSLRHNNGLKGTDEKDFILSPVEYLPGKVFCSDETTAEWPQNADANGAYHIALKGLWVLDQIDQTDIDKLKKAKLAISNQEWLKFIQGRSSQK